MNGTVTQVAMLKIRIGDPHRIRADRSRVAGWLAKDFISRDFGRKMVGLTAKSLDHGAHFVSIAFLISRPTAMTRFTPIPARIFPAIVAATFLIGCAHENTTDYRRADYSSRKPLKSYHSGANELLDADVLGSTAQVPTNEDIRKTLDRATKVGLREGESVLVVQSGEPVPDSRMIAELNQHFRAIPFSGIRSDWIHGDSTVSPDYAKALRFAAAQAGAEKILCFWGQLEVAHHDLSTKTITWLPVVDVIVPDQKENVRVLLKVALVDVRSSAWTVFRTEPQETQMMSTGWGREHVRSPEVRRLQQKSYEVAVNSLMSPR
jgi:hypothetical protein